ncbi:MAG: choice-of-anchor J domain-containing protein [bacterium]
MKKTVTVVISICVYLLLCSALLLAQKSQNHLPRLQGVLGKLELESFEGATFPPEGWKKVTNLGGVGWQQGAAGAQILGFDSTSVIDAAPGGGNFVAYVSWATGDADTVTTTGQATDQWLITPQITDVQPGDTLRFYLKHFRRFVENLDVLISTAGDSLAAFDTLVATIRFSGPGNNNWQEYEYALTDFVDTGADIFIAFREHVSDNNIDGDALFLDLVEVQSLVTSISDESIAPREFHLLQNYPNPFNPSTNIAFALPDRAQVTLKVYNLLGQEVFTALDGQTFDSGQHTVQLNAGFLPSGIYYYKIEAGEFMAVKRMTLLR